MDTSPIDAPLPYPPGSLTVREEVVAGRAYRLRQLDDFGAASVLVDRLLRTAPPSVRQDASPMFGVVWPVARPLAERVAAVASRSPRCRCLELGCGLALPSLVAARHGWRAVATDQHPHAGPFLAENAERNGVSVAFAPLDWRRTAPPEIPEAGFDVVMASDVLYARELPALLARTFARFLAPGGTGWLTDPGRAWLPEFEAACHAEGLSVEVDVADAGTDEVFFLELRR